MYAKDALNSKNILVALLMIIWRILRCNPFSSGGYDPAIKDYPDNKQETNQDDKK